MKKILIILLLLIVLSLQAPILTHAEGIEEVPETTPPTEVASYFDTEILPAIKTFVASAGAVIVVLLPIIKMLSTAKKSSAINNSRITDLTVELSAKNSMVVNLKEDIAEIKRLVEINHKEDSIVRLNCPTCIASGTAEKIVEAQHESKTVKP